MATSGSLSATSDLRSATFVTFGYFRLLLATFGYFCLLLPTFGYLLLSFTLGCFPDLRSATFGYFCTFGYFGPAFGLSATFDILFGPFWLSDGYPRLTFVYFRPRFRYFWILLAYFWLLSRSGLVTFGYFGLFVPTYFWLLSTGPRHLGRFSGCTFARPQAWGALYKGTYPSQTQV